MTGLILKDILMMRKTLKTYVIFFACYLGLSAAGVFPLSFAISFISITVAVLPISAFSYDDMAKWDRYAASLPMGRRSVVAARYLFVLLMMLACAAFGLLSTVVSSLAGAGEDMNTMLVTMLGVLAYGIILNDIMLPLIYILGAERSRSYLYIIVFVPVILLFLASRLELMDLSWLNGIPEEAALAFFALQPVAALAGLGLSYLASCRIYEKKEF